MVSDVKLTLKKENGNTQAYTVKTENKKYLQCILGMTDFSSPITNEQKNELQDIMSIGGDAGILDYQDLSPKHKLDLAKMTSKYADDYEMELVTQNGKQFYKFTIKKGMFNGFFNKNISAYEIKDAFKLDSKKYETEDPWGHRFKCSALKYYNTGEDKAMDWRSTDTAELKSGMSFILPVEDVTFDF